MGSCNPLDDLNKRICVLKKMKYLYLYVFNMIALVNESKTLTKQLSCKCKYKFEGRKYNSDRNWNSDKFRCECKNLEENRVFQKNYIWKSAIFNAENGKYLARILDDSVITCDEIVNSAYIVSTAMPTNAINIVSTNVMSTASINVHQKIVRYKMDCYILLMVLLVILLLFIVAIICYHYAKHRLKQKSVATLTI